MYILVKLRWTWGAKTSSFLLLNALPKLCSAFCSICVIYIFFTVLRLGGTKLLFISFSSSYTFMHNTFIHNIRWVPLFIFLQWIIQSSLWHVLQHLLYTVYPLPLRTNFFTFPWNRLFYRGSREQGGLSDELTHFGHARKLSILLTTSFLSVFLPIPILF